MSKNTVDIANALLAEKAALEARVKELEGRVTAHIVDRKRSSEEKARLEAELVRRDARVEELESICAETYQVVGALADAAGCFETSDGVSKALENLSEAKLVHSDILPFVAEPRAALPEGWKLVPVEPTEEMLHASYSEASVYSPSAYRAMLAAAPTPR